MPILEERSRTSAEYSGVSRGGGLGCSSTPLAQAVKYIIEASGSSPVSPGFSKRDHFFSKYYAWHGTSKYFVGTVTCHCLCYSRDYYRSPLDRELFADRNGGVVSCRCGPSGPMLLNKVAEYC